MEQMMEWTLVKMSSFQEEMKANQENMDGWVEEMKAC
jgi:hypothetical protein